MKGLVLVLAFAIAALSPRPARANFGDDAAAAVAVFSALVILDGTFITYDAVVAGKGEHPSKGWAIAELVASAPQSLIAASFTAGGQFSSEEEVSLISLPFATVTGALTTHSIWALATEDVRPGTLFFLSPPIAADAALSGAAIAAMFSERRVFTRELGVTELIVTIPQVFGGSMRLGLDASDRLGWAAFTAWSGALMLHGVASVIAGGSKPSPSPASASLSPVRREGRPRPRIHGLGPAPLAGAPGRSPGYGLVLQGSF